MFEHKEDNSHKLTLIIAGTMASKEISAQPEKKVLIITIQEAMATEASMVQHQHIA